jgi:CLIP-associating protein 1/2
MSENDLTRETDKIITNLSSPDLDWNIRNEALQKFQRLIFGGATQYSNFIPILQKLKEPLTIQVYLTFLVNTNLILKLSELRSTIVKEACETLTLLSTALSDSFDSFSEYFLPVLLKIVINSISIIAETGHKCIKNVLQNTRNDKLLPTIIKSSNNHKLLKYRCIDYLLVFLTELSTNTLEKYQDIIEDHIKVRLSDALPEVRSTAKQCYWSYCSHFPERANSIFNSLDSSVQKHLKDEKFSIKSVPKKPTDSDTVEKVSVLNSNGKPQRTLSAPALSLGKPVHSSNNSAELRHTTTAVTLNTKPLAKTVNSLTSRPLRVIDEDMSNTVNSAPPLASTLTGPKRVAKAPAVPGNHIIFFIFLMHINSTRQ